MRDRLRAEAAQMVVTAARKVDKTGQRLMDCIDEFGNDASEACGELFEPHLDALTVLHEALAALDGNGQEGQNDG